MFKTTTTLWLALWLTCFACVGTHPLYHTVRRIGFCLGKVEQVTTDQHKKLDHAYHTTWTDNNEYELL